MAYLLGLYVAGVLAVAAFAKAGDPALFVDQITAHRITPASWSPFLAYFFVAVELLAAVGLIVFLWPRLVFCATILLMLGFIAVTAIAWSMGNAESCGCFGRLVERGPQQVIIEDVIVIAVSLLALRLLRASSGERAATGRGAAVARWLTGGVRAPAWRRLAAVPLVLAAVGLTAFGTALPIDRWVVDLGPGDDLSGLTADGLRFPLDQGWVLVALVGPDCPACEAGVPVLKDIAAQRADLRVVAIHPGGSGEAQAWRMCHLPSFPVASASPRALRQYYRALPTIFLLHDGILRRAWWGRIAPADETLAALPPARG